MFEVIGGSSELFSVVSDAPGNILCLLKKRPKENTLSRENSINSTYVFIYQLFIFVNCISDDNHRSTHMRMHAHTHKQVRLKNERRFSH